MSYSVTTLDGDPKPRRLPARELDAIETRILGSLMEKQLTTPETYPLTVNSLVTACNQKSNREPVMELNESEVQHGLDRLQEERLVWKVLSSRATRWDHNADREWQLDRAGKAVITLLFLRGAQTFGELRGRSDRLHAFETIADIEATLQRLGSGEAPLVRELPRRPGQKETRWMHLLSGQTAVEAETPASSSASISSGSSEPVSMRVQRLEEQVTQLTNEMRELKVKLGE